MFINYNNFTGRLSKLLYNSRLYSGAWVVAYFVARCYSGMEDLGFSAKANFCILLGIIYS